MTTSNAGASDLDPPKVQKPKRNFSRAERVAEARALREHILKSVGLTDKAALDFVRYRFELLLIWYGDRAPKLRRQHLQIALAVIAAGLLSSGLTAVAKGQGSDFEAVVGWMVIFLGIIVGLGTGLTQISRPSQKSVAYRTAQADLRREGWDIVHRRGKYKTGAAEEVFATFVDVVLDLEARARAVETAEEPPPDD